MKTVLKQLGLNEKEARFYMYLLKDGSKSASEISKALKESRTNTYMVLNSLMQEKMVEERPGSKVRRYIPANPEKLKNLIALKQQQLRQSHAALSAALPGLSSMYRLGTHKPGVVYLEGIEGFQTFLEDIYKSGKTVHLLASDIVPQVEDAWAILEKETRRRASRGVKTKAIFHKQVKKILDREVFKTKGFELRFWTEKPLEGEIVVYGNKVAFTAYRPAIITTVITNDVLADTFLIVFNQLWKTSEKV